MTSGATHLGEGRTLFRVWAPGRSVELRLESAAGRTVPLEPDPGGYHAAVVEGTPPGTRYRYVLDGGPALPDPASRSQPEGVHGPSEVVDPAFPWADSAWVGLPLDRLVFYELHVGTFSPEGTFDAVVPRLEALRELGVTALELMPASQFPGSRNWGYDGVFPFAAQDSYGGPGGLRRLVDACHAAGIALFLDVVYNHLGPEGNVLGRFGPYFTDRYRTPWGQAINFDGADSDEVRAYFLESARWWIEDCHVDGLRLDAVHAIIDISPYPFLEELAAAARGWEARLGRKVHLVAENGRNDPRLAERTEQGGYGLDAVWNDDFHHALHALLTGGRDTYYRDFGKIEQLEKGFREGFVLSGERSPFFRRRHGRSSRNLPAERMVVFAQNHDQVGNRMRGERLSALVSFEAAKLAAAAALLSPYLPLLFMGEEYGDPAPFQYFVSHGDPELAEAVRRGRVEEFKPFQWGGEPDDPQDPATFERSRLDFGKHKEGRHAALWAFYRELLALRRALPALARLSKEAMEVGSRAGEDLLWVRRWGGAQETLALFHFGRSPRASRLPLPRGIWAKCLDSAEAAWDGPGSPLPPRIASEGELSELSLAPESAALFVRNRGEWRDEQGVP